MVIVVVVVSCRVDSVVVDGVNGVDVIDGVVGVDGGRGVGVDDVVGLMVLLVLMVLVIFGSSISGGNCASFGRFPHQ